MISKEVGGRPGPGEPTNAVREQPDTGGSKTYD